MTSESLSPSAATTETFREKLAAARQLIKEQIKEGAAGDVCITSSFQAEDVVLVHMVKELLPSIPVVFLDTGYHFAETYEYRDRIAREWSLNLVNLLPEQTVAEQEAQFGILNQTEPSRCCGMRKVKPLFSELEKYRLWFTGLRKEQAKSRAQLNPVDDFALPTGKAFAQDQPAHRMDGKRRLAVCRRVQHPVAFAL